MLHRDPMSTRKETLFFDGGGGYFALILSVRMAVGAAVHASQSEWRSHAGFFFFFFPLLYVCSSAFRKIQKKQASLNLFKGKNDSFKVVICQYLPFIWELLLIPNVTK